MALTDEGNGGIPATMLVSPTGMGGYGNPYPVYMGNGNNGGNMWGGDGSWIILLIIVLLAANGGWGNGAGNGFGGMPVVINDGNGGGNVQRGFDQAAVMGGINGVQAGLGDIQQALCAGFAGTTAAVNGAQNALAQQLYTNQIAELERSYAAQTAQTQGMTALQAQLAQCCCENRLASANLDATIARENCADREALNYATRDILANQNAGIQRIIDQMTADKIDAKNDTIAQLRQELIFARGQASQDVQTATIQAGQRALANEVEQYVLPTPRPAYIVQNPNCCQQNLCGCGVA